MIGECFLVATWYAKGLRNPEAFTAASRKYPRGSQLCVHRGASHVIVTVNDWVEEPTVDLDLSRGAFRVLSPLSTGKITVRAHTLQRKHP